jgi:hypothetical protein
MRHYLDSIVSLIQERSAEELIVGVFLALVLAMAGAGVHALARRKVKDTVTLLTVVCLIANLVAMVAAAGYVRMRLGGSNLRRPGDLTNRPWPGSAQIRDITLEATARTILRGADVDRDGALSATEAAEAATRFVRQAETEAGKPLDWRDLGDAMKKRVRVFGNPPADRDNPPSSPQNLEAQLPHPPPQEAPGPPPPPPDTRKR